jgi:hypothetical protein
MTLNVVWVTELRVSVSSAIPSYHTEGCWDCPEFTWFRNMCVQNITSPSANCLLDLGHNDLELYLHRNVFVAYQGLVVNFFHVFHNPLLEFPERNSVLLQVSTVSTAIVRRASRK